MAITPLPDVPLRSDAPATFVTKADAFLGALNLFATEVDAVGVALTLGATNSTSTTSLLIGLGSKSLTVQTGKSYVVGMTVKIASTATGVDWMLGDITSYTTGTGALVVTVVGISGSGTFAVWSISQSATGGAKLGINSDITSLTALDTSILNIGSGQIYKDASGNVGIGTSPSSKLHVYGGAGTAIAIQSSAGNQWRIGDAIGAANGTLVTYDYTNSQHVWDYKSGAAGYHTLYTAGLARMQIDSSGNVGIGTSGPSASAILDAQSTTKGVRFPNMTTTQKTAVATPAAGLVVFDTTLAKLCVYSGAAWQTITSV